MTSRLIRPHWTVARTWFLQPALPDADDRFARAAASPVDVVILDLEDGLPAPHKDAGRAAAAQWLQQHHAWVRIGDITSDTWAADLAAIGSTPGLDGVVLAKTESPDHVVATAAHLPARIPIIALIESARGLEDATDIARSSRCSRLAFGVGDFRRDTGISDDPMALAYARSRLVISSCAAELPPPIDGPTLRTNTRRLARDCAVAKSMGMSARLCLDLGHAETINNLLSPSPDEISAARGVVERLGDGASVYDGSDLPNLARAEATLELAGKLGLDGQS